MSKIVIIGAGAMGSAFALPCLDNNHDINIVGTHLENDFIDQLKKNDNFLFVKPLSIQFCTALVNSFILYSFILCLILFWKSIII